MTIENDQQLAKAVDEAGALLQSIQDYVQRDFSRSAKVRFPRGYIRTVQEARGRLSCLNDRSLKSNIAYTMQLADVQHWLMMRTDLGGMAKEMVIKLQIFLLGTIVESITKVYLRGRCGRNFNSRAEYLHVQAGVRSCFIYPARLGWSQRSGILTKTGSSLDVIPFGQSPRWIRKVQRLTFPQYVGE